MGLGLYFLISWGPDTVAKDLATLWTGHSSKPRGSSPRVCRVSSQLPQDRLPSCEAWQIAASRQSCVPGASEKQKREEQVPALGKLRVQACGSCWHWEACEEA